MARPEKAVQVPAGYLAVGHISGVHGLRGEVKVELYTDFPDRFSPGVVLFAGNHLEELTVRHARPHKGQMLLAFADIEDRDAADELRGQWLFVDEKNAVALEDDSYWIHDILGMTVFAEDGELLGVIQDVLFTGANEVYVVQRTLDADGVEELLLPAITDVVRQVNVEARTMTVHLLPGLRPEA